MGGLTFQLVLLVQTFFFFQFFFLLVAKMTPKNTKISPKSGVFLRKILEKSFSVIL